MSNPLEPQIAPTLTRLERFWVWNRKELVQQVRQLAQAADTHTAHLANHRQTVMDDLNKACADHEQLKATYTQLNSTADALRHESDDHLAQLQHSMAELAAMHTEHTGLQASHTTLESTHSALKETHIQLQGVHNRLVDGAETLRSQLAQSRSSEADIQQRYGLVERILKSEPLINPALSKLQHWLSSEFVQELQQLELSSDFTAQTLLQAQAIGMHVELLAESPALRNKFLVAVAGGFSSGKSSFVSSFMGPETASLLATGIQPVTAIPTYVMPGEHLSIQGHSYKKASVPLDKEIYGRLSHEFLAKIGFNLKQIMPFVVIEAPMRQIEHMAFIDMPGYDSAASAETHTTGDRDTAGASLAEADAVIWLVGSDTNGTLPADDLNFLLDHANNKPLYVVLNKADQRSAEHLQAVLLDIQNLLEDSGLDYKGISAYNSILGEELFHCGQSMAEVFQHWDHTSSATEAVHKEFDLLMNRLEEASQTAHTISEDVHGLVHSLGVDLYELSTYLPAEENASQESSARSDHQSFDENRAPRLRKQAEDKLARLKASTAMVKKNRAAEILEKLREHGHELLQQSCGDGARHTPATLGQWID